MCILDSVNQYLGTFPQKNHLREFLNRFCLILHAFISQNQFKTSLQWQTLQFTGLARLHSLLCGGNLFPGQLSLLPPVHTTGMPEQREAGTLTPPALVGGGQKYPFHLVVF